VKHKRPLKIKDRHSGRILFETEAETLKGALEEAVISGVNLSCADLRNADVGGAYLAGAQLSNADFSGANLFGITLDRAVLIGAHFYSVDMRYANIRYANLKKAVLRNSELICACFLESNLVQADFQGSNLQGVSLQDANLTGVFFDPRPIAPEEGSLVGWKGVFDKQGNRIIAQLLIPEDARRMTPLFGRYCRAEFVKVLELSQDVSITKCRFNPERIYAVGETVHTLNYDNDNNVHVEVIQQGLQFYLTREEAEQEHQSARWFPPMMPTIEYWKSATYRGWIDGIKYLNQPDNREGEWRAGEMFGVSTAKLMNQWDKEKREEKSQKRPNRLISLARCTPINPLNRTLGFYLNDAGYTIVPANSCPPTVENYSQEYPSSWEKGRVLQDFQVVYISKGKGIFQSTQSGLISINAGDALLLFPGEWNRYRPDPEFGWTAYWISFNGDVRCASRMKGAVV